MSNHARVHAGVPTGGQFAAATHLEGQVDLTQKPTPAGLDLSQMDEPGIDQELARLMELRWDAMARLSAARERAHHQAGDRRRYVGRTPRWGMSDDEAVQVVRTAAEQQGYEARQAGVVLAGVEKMEAELAGIKQEQDPLEEEFERRGGWTRAFLVADNDGHVHRSMRCSTCNNGASDTRFQWLTDYSGATQDQIVADAGWRACTICYPCAPVGDAHGLPSRITGRDEAQKAEASAARTDRKAGLAAARIAKGLTADGSEFVVAWTARNAPGWERTPDGGRAHVVRDRPRKEYFKTERAAVNWYLEEQMDPAAAAEKQPALDSVVEAVAAKHGKTVEQIRAELAVKVAAKRKREGW